MPPVSELQQNAINEVLKGKNVLVEAGAGSGKSTLIVSMADQFLQKYPNSKVLIVMFQNRVCKEMKDKIKKSPIPSNLQENIEVGTTYSLGRRLLVDHYTSSLNPAKSSIILGGELSKLYKQFGGKQSPRAIEVLGSYEETKRIVNQLYNLAQTRLIFDYHGIARIEQERGMFSFTPHQDIYQVVVDSIDKACEVLRYGWDWGSFKGKHENDFLDMVVIPAREGFQSRDKYDLVLVDEAQDVANSQWKVVQAYGDDQTQWVWVGDKNQCIFQFAGAETDMLDRIKAHYNAFSCPLDVTYRCSHKVVELANTIVPSLKAHPDNKTGFVGYITMSNALERMQGGDFVLARTIATLLEVAVMLFTTNKKFTFRGVDIKPVIKAALDDIRSGYNFKHFHLACNEYVSDTVKFLQDKHGDGGDEKIQEVQRLGSALIALYDYAVKSGVKEDNFENWIFELIENDTPKKRSEPTIILLSSHQSKGLETETVFAIEPQGGFPYRTQKMSSAQKIEENNLWYVTATRAKGTLWRVVPDSSTDVPIVEPTPLPVVVAPVYQTEEQKFLANLNWDKSDVVDLIVAHDHFVSKLRMLEKKTRLRSIEKFQEEMKREVIARKGENVWNEVAGRIGVVSQKSLW